MNLEIMSFSRKRIIQFFQSYLRLRSKKEVFTRNLKNFYRVIFEIILFIFARILGLFWRIQKSKNHILTKVAFPEPVPAFLYDSNEYVQKSVAKLRIFILARIYDGLSHSLLKV